MGSGSTALSFPGFGRCCGGKGGSGYSLAPSCAAPPFAGFFGRRLSSASTAAWILRCLDAAAFACPALAAEVFRCAVVVAFLGMPAWAQWFAEWLPLTHFIRIVRAIMLKGATLQDLQYDALALVGLMAIAMIIAVTRFRRTLD